MRSFHAFSLYNQVTSVCSQPGALPNLHFQSFLLGFLSTGRFNYIIDHMIEFNLQLFSLPEDLANSKFQPSNHLIGLSGDRP